MKIIFLDIDGVLNCRTSRSRCGKYIGIDTDKLLRLKKIVDSTGAKIVLVSTWKYGWQKLPMCKQLQDELANYLDKRFESVNLEVYDKTFDNSEKGHLSRGEGIVYYLDGKSVERFVILDDFQFDYDGCGLTDYYVKTDNSVGLTDENVLKAIEILQGN